MHVKNAIKINLLLFCCARIGFGSVLWVRIKSNVTETDAKIRHTDVIRGMPGQKGENRRR